jgi:hypothetical protein
LKANNSFVESRNLVLRLNHLRNQIAGACVLTTRERFERTQACIARYDGQKSCGPVGDQTTVDQTS